MHKGRLGAAKQHDTLVLIVHRVQHDFAVLLCTLEAFNSQVEALLDELDHESKKDQQ